MKKTNFILIIAVFLLALPSALADTGTTRFGTNFSVSGGYIVYARFNQSDSSTIQSTVTGQTITEQTANTEVKDTQLIMPVGASAVCIAQTLNETTTSNYTIDYVYRMTTFTPGVTQGLHLFVNTDCTGTSYFQAGIVNGVDGNDGSFIMDSAGVWTYMSPIVQSSNFHDTTILMRTYVNVTGDKVNVTFYNMTTAGDGIITLKQLASLNNKAPAVALIKNVKSIQLFQDTAGKGGFNITEIAIYNGTTRPSGASTPDTTPPYITNYSNQGSSCTNWNANPSNPCTTSDTTPTLYFNTSEAAYCAIAANSWNYTQMGSPRGCTSGDGTTEHACDLIPEDELVYEDSIVYLSCKDSSGNMNMSGKSTSGPLSLTITGLEASGDSSIGLGIQNALLSSYTNYTSLQIYARNLSNAQVKGTFDWAAKKGSKMWAFNYVTKGEQHVNMFNLTPVLYTLELANKTSTNITFEVEKLINATK